MMRKITEKAVSSLEGVEELVSREYISLYLKIANTARTQVLLATTITDHIHYTFYRVTIL